MASRTVRFGVFELDPDTRELRRRGRRVPLQLQPGTVLLALLDPPGRLVGREELKRRLWPEGVTVDFEQALNKAVAKLRDALGDRAENPRFIETLPKRGYRFLAPVEAVPPADPRPSAAPAATDRDDHGRDGGDRAGDELAAARPAAAPGRLRVARQVAVPVAAAALLAAVIVWEAPGPASRDVAVTESSRAPRAGTDDRGPGLTPIFAAKDAFARGRVALAKQSPQALRQAAELFSLATSLSPAYADAWASLAEAHVALAFAGAEPTTQGLAAARAAANRALSLAAGHGGAHAALGATAAYLDGDWTTADWHFERAVSTRPGDAGPRMAYALALAARGALTSAERQARVGLTAAPVLPASSDTLGYVLYLAHRYEDAEQQFDRALSLDPDYLPAVRHVARLRVEQGRAAEAVALLERITALSGDAPRARAELAWARGLSGDRSSARRLLRDLGDGAPASLALAAWGAGDAVRAADWLVEALRTHAIDAAFVRVDPVWAGLRQLPPVRAALPERLAPGPATG
ncbi:MAG: winged helix-turn-helix domain-containing protein [Vicinamibacterales bacterium]